jgi:hypothetical protein
MISLELFHLLLALFQLALLSCVFSKRFKLIFRKLGSNGFTGTIPASLKAVQGLIELSLANDNFGYTSCLELPSSLKEW